MPIVKSLAVIFSATNRYFWSLTVKQPKKAVRVLPSFGEDEFFMLEAEMGLGADMLNFIPDKTQRSIIP
jgi:hypothetical protein